MHRLLCFGENETIDRGIARTVLVKLRLNVCFSTPTLTYLSYVNSLGIKGGSSLRDYGDIMVTST